MAEQMIIASGTVCTFKSSAIADKDLVYRSGKKCVVLRPLTEQEEDSHEVGPMYLVEFTIDAQQRHAFSDELTPE